MQILYTHTNIFDLPIVHDATEAVCVTTNAMIKKDGTAVMGKGIAKEANDRYDLSKELANRLQANGNHVYMLKIVDNGDKSFKIFSFPTKYDWRDNSDLNLIRQSAIELMSLLDYYAIKRCYLTPPGCANGHLSWDMQVMPMLAPILDDRVTIVIRR